MIATADRFPSNTPNDGPAVGTLEALAAVEIIAQIRGVEDRLRDVPNHNEIEAANGMLGAARGLLAKFVNDRAGRAHAMSDHVPRFTDEDRSFAKERREVGENAIAMFRAADAAEDTIALFLEALPPDLADGVSEHQMQAVATHLKETVLHYTATILSRVPTKDHVRLVGLKRFD